jgi:adenosylcobinamide-phosphate synthase
MESLLILTLALAVDVLLGEPPRALHPVVWMGKMISWGERLAPQFQESPTFANRERRKQVIWGTLITLLTVVVFAAAAYFLLRYLRELSWIAYAVAGGFLLKASFSFKELHGVALEMKGVLARDDLEKARVKASALVSRDVKALGKPQLVSATLESVAENLNDSIVAPLFYFLIFGVPGAVAYRAVNTLDAMIGYHGRYEYLGKVAARADDVLNFVPARISAVLLVAAAWLCRSDARNAWRIMLRDHAKTESPNSGLTMSAMAGALRTRLEKAGYYSLGDVNTPLTPQLIARGVKLVAVSFCLWALFCIAVEVCQIAFVS